MGIKTLLLVLFLYICLAWGVAFYIDPSDFARKGLLYTLIGFAGAIAYVLGSLIWGWIALNRARRATRPGPIVKSATLPQQHPDDLALTQLLGEVRARLPEAFSGSDPREPLSGIPLYLIVGTESAGKTTALVNSGMDVRQLAGQGRAEGIRPNPTAVADIWLVNNAAMFIEIGGRHFSGDLGRWNQLLETLNARRPTSFLERLRKGQPAGLDLRGVLYVCDIGIFDGTPDAHQLGQQARLVGERLGAISRAFRRRFPVYTIFSKTDSVRYFPEYFGRFPESETAQPLGCTLAISADKATAPVLRDNRVKQLTTSFNGIYHALTDRRTWALYGEQNALTKTRIFEFPREFRRIRQTLVDFLAEAFHPRDLQPGALNRGFYFAGRREVILSQLASLSGSGVATMPFSVSGGATRFFSVEEAARLTRESPVQPQTAGRRETRWMFLKDLFQQVILRDQPLGAAVVIPDRKLALSQTVASVAAIALSSFLALAWAISWAGNVRLLGRFESVAAAQPEIREGSIQANHWQRLEELRQELSVLASYDRDGVPWRLRWGMYAGDSVYPNARITYLRRLQRLAISAAHVRIVSNLQSLPEQPDLNAPYEPAASNLKAHLTLSKGPCKLPPSDLAGVLKSNLRAVGSPIPASPDLVDRQIEYFASETAQDNPIPFQESPEARQRALQYLSRVRGIDRAYRSLLAKVDASSVTPARLADRAPDYSRVLRGPNEVRAAFTPAGWSAIQAAMRSGEVKTDDDACLAAMRGSGGGPFRADTDLAKQIESRYAREYIETWQKYLTQFSVIGYTGMTDAVRKLEQLEAYKSPLLALLAMASDNTHFPSEQVASQLQNVPIIGSILSRAGKQASKNAASAEQVLQPLAGPPEKIWTIADVSRSFQPIHFVVPPGTERWVTEKNSPYVDALGGLRHGLEAIASDKPDTPDCNLHKAGDEAFRRASDSLSQLAKGFDPSSDVSTVVEKLLRQPINWTRGFIRTNCDPSDAAKGKANKDLRTSCQQLQSVLGKYPFGTGPDLAASELSAFFAPQGGRVWTFQAQALKFVIRDGSAWRQNPATPDPIASEALLRFLNKAQQIADAFFGDGSAQPHFVVALRPEIAINSRQLIRLTIHGQQREFHRQSMLREQFSWPAPTPASAEAIGRSGAAGFTSAFSTQQGPWALFRFLGDADDRAVGDRNFVWTSTRGPSGQRAEPLDTPVRLTLVEFPGKADVFNRKFYSDFRCPSTAIQ